MLSKNQVVVARRAIEKMYVGTCQIINFEKTVKPNGATKLSEVVKQTDVPCRLVFLNVNPAIETRTNDVITQTIQIYLAPEIEILTGSKVVVSQNGETTEYKASGKAAYFLTHQEVKLELFKGWS